MMVISATETLYKSLFGKIEHGKWKQQVLTLLWHIQTWLAVA